MRGSFHRRGCWILFFLLITLSLFASPVNRLAWHLLNYATGRCFRSSPTAFPFHPASCPPRAPRPRTGVPKVACPETSTFATLLHGDEFTCRRSWRSVGALGCFRPPPRIVLGRVVVKNRSERFGEEGAVKRILGEGTGVQAAEGSQEDDDRRQPGRKKTRQRPAGDFS